MKSETTPKHRGERFQQGKSVNEILKIKLKKTQMNKKTFDNALKNLIT